MDEEGWTPCPTVFLEEGRPTAVIGPDGQPLRDAIRHAAGFDLSRRRPPAEHDEGRDR